MWNAVAVGHYKKARTLLRWILKIATLACAAALISFAIVNVRSYQQFKAHFIRAL